MYPRACLLLALVTASLGVGNATASITIHADSRIMAYLRSGPSTSSTFTELTTASDIDYLPAFGVTGQVAHSLYDNTASADWQSTVSDDFLAFGVSNIDLHRPVGPTFSTSKVEAILHFSIDASTPYSVLGALRSTGPAQAQTRWEIKDLATNNFLLYEDDFTRSTANGTLALNGTKDGDIWTSLGSPSGVLLPGEYQFRFVYLLYDLSDEDTEGADVADAWTRLTLGSNEAALPEPAALVVWAILGGLGLFVARRRR